MAIPKEQTSQSSGIILVNSNGVQAQGINYNQPLVLSSSDVNGIQIISFQLMGIENFAI